MLLLHSESVGPNIKKGYIGTFSMLTPFNPEAGVKGQI